MSEGPSRKNDLQLDNDLWRFALSFYRGDSIPAACLALQDELGVDVNVLIFAIFAACRGISLSDSDLADIDCLVTEWRSTIVQPLRRLRRTLKAGPAPAPGAISDGLRNRIKSVELEAEKIELAVLSAWLATHIPAEVDAAQVEKIPMQVARYFACATNHSGPDRVAEASFFVLSTAARKIAENAATQDRPWVIA